MSTMELESKRMGIIRLLLGINNAVLLQEIENMLYANAPIMGDYSAENLRNAVLRSREDIRAGRVVTMEKMRAKHPIAV